MRWTSSARSPTTSTTRCLPRRRTPAISAPSIACSGGSNVFSALMPGASVDSIVAPRSAASNRRAVISTSGSSGTCPSLRAPQRPAADDAQQRVHDARVELHAGARAQAPARLAAGQRGAVGAVARHRVERVGGRDDPRPQRDPGGAQAVGIAAAVPRLVRRAYEEGEVLEAGDLGEQLLAGDRVAANPRALLRVERPLPVEEVRVDRELADVVQHRDELDLGRLERVQGQALGDVARERGQAVAVVGRRRVVAAQLARERLHGLGHPRRAGERRQRASPMCMQFPNARAPNAIGTDGGAGTGGGGQTDQSPAADSVCATMAGRLAIVGGDAAGMSAASAARRRDPDLEVVAFERGPYTSYSACGIPYYLGGLFDDSDRLVSRSPEEHRARGITVHTRTEVTGIDLAARRLTVLDHQSGDERTEGFDQLVVATGAEAVPPPIPGADAPEPVRTVDAAERFRAALGRNLEHHHIVVIGGGYIGIEMAEALVQRDIPTTLVEALPQLMSTLDPD